MADFHRTFVNDRSFIRGAARILIAPYSQAAPTKIDDIIALTAVTGPPAVGLYDAKPGWVDLGGTKTGFNVTINNSEESFSIDQVLGDISSAPTSWEVSAGTSLAEMTPERLQTAWEGSAITTDTTPATGSEQEIGFGNPTSYTQRRLAAVFMRPNGKIRAYIFWKIQRMPQESSFTHSPTGEQISVPVRWRALADTSVSDPLKRFFIIRDQAIPTP